MSNKPLPPKPRKDSTQQSPPPKYALPHAVPCTKTPSRSINLSNLPTEILFQITSHLRPPAPAPLLPSRFDGPERIAYVRSACPLVALALTCRRLTPIAQEALLHTIVLGGFDGLPALVALLRFLMLRPDMRVHVKYLRLGLPPEKCLYFKSERDRRGERISARVFGSVPGELWGGVVRVVERAGVGANVKDVWMEELRANFARPMCGVLVVLLDVEGLSVGHSLGMTRRESVLREMFGCGRVRGEVDLRGVKGLKGLEGGRGLVLPALVDGKSKDGWW
ncbi:hypothetical protein HBH70_086920 [Parastagonospora nodorum]|nr:hypothetical protein HBH51_086990 [Parastagonospora nodorum]KAH4001523.1 hypothetical protein HBI10_087450 [Parastagonospora nodorum]KAH4027256.1 hypothetical protein HBI13_056470 [Parastagonospora nodorum]KAH4035571.1 hypothetical protein HBI09_088680 [Parastagonospora nodorum]KAH4261851.1 hypothetical protein HBI03_113690 [Parastagonospora nodorum]